MERQRNPGLWADPTIAVQVQGAPNPDCASLHPGYARCGIVVHVEESGAVGKPKQFNAVAVEIEDKRIA